MKSYLFKSLIIFCAIAFTACQHNDEAVQLKNIQTHTDTVKKEIKERQLLRKGNFCCGVGAKSRFISNSILNKEK